MRAAELARLSYRPDARLPYRPDARHAHRPDARLPYRPDAWHAHRPDAWPRIILWGIGMRGWGALPERTVRPAR